METYSHSMDALLTMIAARKNRPDWPEDADVHRNARRLMIRSIWHLSGESIRLPELDLENEFAIEDLFRIAEKI